MLFDPSGVSRGFVEVFCRVVLAADESRHFREAEGIGREECVETDVALFLCVCVAVEFDAVPHGVVIHSGLVAGGPCGVRLPLGVRGRDSVAAPFEEAVVVAVAVSGPPFVVEPDGVVVFLDPIGVAGAKVRFPEAEGCDGRHSPVGAYSEGACDSGDEPFPGLERELRPEYLVRKFFVVIGGGGDEHKGVPVEEDPSAVVVVDAPVPAADFYGFMPFGGVYHVPADRVWDSGVCPPELVGNVGEFAVVVLSCGVDLIEELFLDGSEGRARSSGGAFGFVSVFDAGGFVGCGFDDGEEWPLEGGGQ